MSLNASPPDPSQQGFTYIGLMLFVMLLGIGLAFVGTVWQTVARRDKERELLFVGDQYRKAIEAFREHNRGADDGYPKNFGELLLDPHRPKPQRYLRKAYLDPLTGSADWGLVKTAKGGIAGVYSLADGEPVKLTGFPVQYESFVGAGNYAAWKFIADPGDGPAVALSTTDANAPPAPPQIPVNTPPPLPEREPGKDPSCEWVAANDQRVCNLEKIKWRDSAVACFASAGERAAYCASGVRPADLPPLTIRYGTAPSMTTLQ
ncbi:MAG: type II secretion system protein [Betaproteobacteria bacterium]